MNGRRSEEAILSPAEAPSRSYKMLIDGFGEHPIILDDSVSEGREKERRGGDDDMVVDDDGDVMFMHDLADVGGQSEAAEAWAEPQQPVITEEDACRAGTKTKSVWLPIGPTRFKLRKNARLRSRGQYIDRRQVKAVSVRRWFKLTDEEGAQVLEEWRGVLSTLQVGC